MINSDSSTNGRQRWQRSARLTAWWSSVCGVLMVGIAAVVVWTWRDQLPDPIAAHWNGTTPDRFQPLGAVLLGSVLMVVLLCALFGAIAWFWGSSAMTRRMVAAACVWSGGLGASLLLFTVGGQRGLADAQQADLPGWTLALVLTLPLVPAVVAALITPGDRHQPASAPVAQEAPRMDLADDERAVWIDRADGGPGLIIGAVVIVILTLLAVALQFWALLVAPVLLAALFAVMFVFTVRVDAAGLTVRSWIGWPGTHIPADEIVRASVTEVSPMREFGGWGWRVGRGGRVGVVLRGGEALLVERTGDRSFVVTVDDPGPAAALLNTLADRARS